MLGRTNTVNVRTGQSEFPICGINSTLGLSQLAVVGSPAISEVLIQADPDNDDNVLVGNHVVRSIVLVPGAGVTINTNDLAKIWIVIATQGDQVGWFAAG